MFLVFMTYLRPLVFLFLAFLSLDLDLDLFLVHSELTEREVRENASKTDLIRLVADKVIADKNIYKFHFLLDVVLNLMDHSAFFCLIKHQRLLRAHINTHCK